MSDPPSWFQRRLWIYTASAALTFSLEWVAIAFRYAPHGPWNWLSYFWRALSLGTLPLSILLLVEAVARTLIPSHKRRHALDFLRRLLGSPLGTAATTMAGVAFLTSLVCLTLVSFWVDLDLPVFMPWIHWQNLAQNLGTPIVYSLAAGIGLGTVLSIFFLLRNPNAPGYAHSWPRLSLLFSLVGMLLLPLRVFGFQPLYHGPVALLTWLGFVGFLSQDSRFIHTGRHFRGLLPAAFSGMAILGVVLLLTRLAGIGQEPLAIVDANRPIVLSSLVAFAPRARRPSYQCADRSHPKPSQPRRDKDVVFITIEALAPDIVIPEQSTGPAPTMAMLASTGVDFRNAMSAGSRTSIGLVGLMQSRSGFCTQLDPTPSQPTLFGILRAAGYQTAYSGGFRLAIEGGRYVPHHRALEFGIDTLVDSQPRPDRSGTDPQDAEVRARAEALIEQAARERPLALWVHFVNPHAVYNPPKDFLGSRGSGRLARYEEEVASTDAEVANLLRAFDRLRPGADRLVIIAGDHGQALETPGARFHATDVSNEMIRTVLIINDREHGGRRVDQVVSLMDTPVTILDLLGIEVPPSFQGRSLVSLMGGEPLPIVPVPVEALWKDVADGVIMPPYKLIRWSRPRFEHLYPVPEVLKLFNISADPRERNNLADDLPQIVDSLYALLPREAARASQAQRPPS